MEQETRKEQQAAADDNNGAKKDEQTLTDELFKELTVLGNRFVEVMQAAWNSDDRKRMEADLKKGLNSVAENLEEGFQRISEKQKAKEVLEKADRVAEEVGNKLRGSEAVSDLTRGLVRGLRSLANTMGEWTDELQARTTTVDRNAAAAKPTDETAQNIPIDKNAA